MLKAKTQRRYAGLPTVIILIPQPSRLKLKAVPHAHKTSRVLVRTMPVLAVTHSVLQ
jgi:hypothetical protein